MEQAAGQEQQTEITQQQQPTEQQEADEQQQQREQGSVKWFNAVKGFSFITTDQDKDIDLFVHQSDIQSSGFRSLKQGARVEFVTELTEDGRTKAAAVTGPEGREPEGAPFPRQQMGFFPPGAQAVPYIIVQPGGRMPPGPGAFYYPYNGRGGRGGRGGGRGGMMGGYYFPQGGGGYPRGGVAPGQGGVSSGMQAVVHNLPWQCTWQELKDAFAQWNVVRADIVYDQFGRSKGFGVVRFQTEQDAATAIEQMNNQMIAGRQVTVRLDKYG
eukprot:TRINITY_DN32834_c1_g1_i2.p1 TRINITY_DN32834_c1_g1~~TRINITY_DN32834_c1_g1_i2.p1  ORF type:complete len:270 (+),score=74.41 TRINITY_DN32834_c1_g1_i2:233-1042(+)